MPYKFVCMSYMELKNRTPGDPVFLEWIRRESNPRPNLLSASFYTLSPSSYAPGDRTDKVLPGRLRRSLSASSPQLTY